MNKYRINKNSSGFSDFWKATINFKDAVQMRCYFQVENGTDIDLWQD